MLEVDRHEFAAFLPTYIGKNADKEVLRRWWQALKPFDMAAIKTAFVRRDQEMGGYPEPFQIVERCKTDNVHKAAKASAEVTHWTAQDLLCACRMAEIDWSKAVFAGRRDNFPGTWVERVAMAYDAGLAETAERVVGKYPDLKPVEAAREFMRDFPKGWTVPVSSTVPM